MQPAQANLALPKRPIPQIQPFRETELDTTDFRDWLTRFKLYLRMVEGPLVPGQPRLDDATKMQYLALNLGNHALRTFSRDPAYAQLDDPQATYENFLAAATRHFAPPATRVKARFDFQRRIQEAGENVDEYVTALRTMALDCQFADDQRVQEEILNQLVQGASDLRTQQELLATPDLTLERALTVMRANEAAQLASSAFRSSKVPSAATNQISRNNFRGRGRSKPTTPQGYARELACDGCGSSNHRRGDDRCPAKKLRCNFCHKMGHMERCCRSRNPQTGRGRSQRGYGRGFRGRGQGQFPQSQSGTGGITVADAEVRHVQNGESSKPFFATFHIADGQRRWIPLEMEVDTGAQPSIIPFRWYQQHLQNLPLEHPVHVLKNYDGSSMDGIVGMITTKLLYGGRAHKVQAYIRKGPHKPIAGRNIIRSLQLKVQANEDSVIISTVEIDDICKDFPQLQDNSLGTYPGAKHRIKVRDDVQPKAVPVRPIPLARQQAVEEEIKVMDAAGIWEEVPASEWAHPMVTVMKPDAGVRITTDLTALNKFVIPERYPLPRIKDLFLQFTGATKFSKLDLKKGYYHIPLAEESKHLTTTITPLGLRQYNRLPMGLTDAASAFQRRIQQTLQGLPGVVVYIDDIIVYGKDSEEHDRYLRAVLSRLQENDFRLQPKKCIIGATEIPAFGHIVSADGIKPDPKNVAPIREIPAPTSVKDVQSFLGLINYYNEFIPKLADLAEPLRELVRKDVTFQWTEDCEQSFQGLKDAVAKVTRLALFDPQAKTILTTDASDIGIGGVLTQVQGGKEVPIAFFNRTLDPSEKGYAANEKEALGIIRACEHWENMLLGRRFTIRTDHQALTKLLTNPRNQRQSSKFQRWQQRLSEFDFDIEHVPGEANKVADFLLRTVPAGSPVFGIRLQQLQDEMEMDDILQQVHTCIQTHWPKPVELTPELKPYHRIATELKYRNQLLWKSGKIVVPTGLQREIVHELHQGHPGIDRMKRALRQMYWWPRADEMVQRVVDQCIGCQSSGKTRSTKSIPSNQIPAPERPGAQYALDITGPFENGRYLVVLIDYVSKFPEILDTKNITAPIIIRWLADTFDKVGNPDGLVTDNGPQFVSREFTRFLQDRDIHHYRTAVYNPRENGLVESFNRYLKYGIQASLADNIPWLEGLQKLLTSYRNIPLTSGRTPAEIFYGRSIRSLVQPNLQTPLRQTPRQQQFPIPKANSSGKVYIGPSVFKKGQRVVTKLPHVPKGRSPFSQPKIIERVLGFWTYLLSDGQVWHARKMKAWKAWAPPLGDQEVEAYQPFLPRRKVRQRRSEVARLQDGLTPYFTPR